MVKTMTPYKIKGSLEKQIESIFSSLYITYKKLHLNDGDINYSIRIHPTGKLSSIGQRSCTLFLHKKDFTSNLVVGNICNIDKSYDLIPLYEIINKFNMITRLGNLLLHDIDGNKQLIYKSSVSCGRDFCELTSELIKFQINEFTTCLEYILFQLVNCKREEQI